MRMKLKDSLNVRFPFGNTFDRISTQTDVIIIHITIIHTGEYGDIRHDER